MDWGAAAYLPNGEEVVTRYAPYNFLKMVPVNYNIGTHSFYVSELPAGSSLEVCIEAFAGSGAAKGYAQITGLSVSGNKVTYTVTNGGYGNGGVTAWFGNYLAIACYAKR